LWDWLELLALPLAVALAPIFAELRAGWTRRYTIITLTGLAVFGAIVLGGYLGEWAWTGFRGNTLWDWLHLLLLPLLLPTIVVPALMPMATAGLIVADEGESDATLSDVAEPESTNTRIDEPDARGGERQAANASESSVV
jgi:hypothetical protein